MPFIHTDHVSINYERLLMLPAYDIWKKVILKILLLSHFERRLMNVSLSDLPLTLVILQLMENKLIVYYIYD